MSFIEVDGSHGEGGGQIIRTAVGLSAATGLPVKIQRIRAGRQKPGLSHQHIHAIKSVQKLTKAKVEGLKLGSTELSFIPGTIRRGAYDVDIGTAGSVSLVLQTFLIPAVFSKKEVKIKITGGTDVPHSPPIDYVMHVFLPLILKMGVHIDLKLRCRGHYPRGGGVIEAVVYPSTSEGLVIEEAGALKGIFGVSHCTSLPSHIAKREKKAALAFLKESISMDADIHTEETEGFGEGTGITLWAEFENTVLGASSLGKRDKRAEKVGKEAASMLLNEIKSKATIDSHMGDQLLPYIALAKGASSYICSLTSHAKTNIYTTERLLGGKFEIKGEDEGLVKIECQNP
jgi:RNA 3'-phosphate cyclase